MGILKPPDDLMSLLTNSLPKIPEDLPEASARRLAARRRRPARTRIAHATGTLMLALTLEFTKNQSGIFGCISSPTWAPSSCRNCPRRLVSRNVVRELRKSRRKGVERQAGRRQRGKLKVGVDIPTRDEIKAIVGAAEGRWRPVLLTAIFTGLRASELRGLRWEDVDFDKRALHVRQRADRYSKIGKPKSESGERTVPLTPMVLNTLREWKLACPKSEAALVFPSPRGLIEHHKNIVEGGWRRYRLSRA